MGMCFQMVVTQTIKRVAGVALFGLMAQAAIASTEPANTASDLLKPFEAVYYAYKWDDNLGSAKVSLEELSPGLYSLTYQSKVSKFFLSDKRFEHSIFTVDGDTITPQEYNYSRTGTGSDKSLQVTFNPGPPALINISDDDEQSQINWENEFDNQLYRLDLTVRLAQGISALDYQFINYRGQQKHYGILVHGMEQLDLPYGTIEALKVEIERDSSSRVTYAWFAPDLNYQLVRLQQFKDGDEQGDLRLKAFAAK